MRGYEVGIRSAARMEKIMEIDEAAFFDSVRNSIFKGQMKQAQVDGVTALLNAWQDDYSEYPAEYLAYCLATAYHETAHTMQPIREYGRGRGRSYGRKNKKTGQAYYGRGYVQLTWLYNYKKAGEKLDLELVNNPDKVMIPDIAAKILFSGCIEGWFTRGKLSDHITENKTNFRQCRRIVNGMDRATLIAGYARKFNKALVLSMSEETVTEERLEKAGSETIKATTKNKDAGGAIIGISVIGGASEALNKLKDLAAQSSEWRGILDSVAETLTWLTSFWWLAALAAAGVVIWNNKAIIKARLSDEEKIGRLDNVTPD